MIKIAFIFIANEKNGGTFNYSLSMLNLLLNFVNKESLEIYVSPSNQKHIPENIEYKLIPSLFSLIIMRLARKDIFEDEVVLISPIPLYLAPLFKSSKYIFTLHDLQEKILKSNFSIPTRVYRHFLNIFNIRCSKAIICESEEVKKNILTYFDVLESKINVIPLPPLMQDIHDDISYNIKLPRKFIYYPAHYWPHKNHFRLISAFEIFAKKNQDVHLVMSGNLYQKEGEFNEMISLLSCRNRIHHFGYRDTAFVSYLYKNALMLVMPSLFESISIPVYESFYYGIPACCSDLNGVKAQAKDAAIYFNPENIIDIENSITRLVNDPHLRNTLVIKGRLRLEEMDKSKLTNKILQVAYQ